MGELVLALLPSQTAVARLGEKSASARAQVRDCFPHPPTITQQKLVVTTHHTTQDRSYLSHVAVAEKGRGRGRSGEAREDDEGGRDASGRRRAEENELNLAKEEGMLV